MLSLNLFLNFITKIITRHMANTEFKKSAFRILSDLIKSDNIISASEMDKLDDFSKSLKISEQDKIDSCSITLSAASSFIASLPQKSRNGILRMMEELSLEDGECCRAEALLIRAIDIVNSGNGRIVSMEFNNRPILSTQIVYVDSTYNPSRNELDRDFENLSRIAEMGGFELIYIPRVAREFKEFKSAGDLKRLLCIVNPTLSDSDASNKVSSIQEMDSRYFYLHVLNDKLEMNLHVDTDKPVWMLRLPNSVVNGTGYANFLLMNVDTKDIRGQLEGFVDSLNRLQAPYSVTVNRRSDKARDFLYGGFHKALLDVMAAKKVEKTELLVYLKGEAAPSRDRKDGEKRYSLALRKNDTVYPIYMNGREAALYLLLLLGSASEKGGVCFEYKEPGAKADLQAQYEAAYKVVSVRENAPIITKSSIFLTIKTNVMNALEALEEKFPSEKQKAGLFLLKPTKRDKKTYYVPLGSEQVKIISARGEVLLKSSTIFEDYCKLAKSTNSGKWF